MKTLDKILRDDQRNSPGPPQQLSTLEQMSQKEKDGLEALERSQTSFESHWHSARQFPHYQVVKIMTEDGWNGLYRVEDKRGKPLPRELDQSFTDPSQVIKAIQNYIQQNKIKGTN
jgi:hypothetical protein